MKRPRNVTTAPFMLPRRAPSGLAPARPGCLARLVVALIVSVAPAAAWADTAELHVHFNPRIPYAFRDGDHIGGLVAGPIGAALEAARIPFVWEETPFSRQMALLKGNQRQDCMIGMFRKPEREKFGRFSEPVFRDSPQILLVRVEDAAAFNRYPSIRDAMQKGTFRLLVKETYSYGPAFDQMLAERTGPTVRAYEENDQMLRMLVESMADAMIIAPEEASALIKSRGLSVERFAYIKYPDTPQGELRHLFCSMQVPQATIDRFNRALTSKPR
ncbi:transporter substrate-binding domain-containing protein [Niveibacterium umoris]